MKWDRTEYLVSCADCFLVAIIRKKIRKKKNFGNDNRESERSAIGGEKDAGV